MLRLTLTGMDDYDRALLHNIPLPDEFDSAYMREVLLEQCGDLYPYMQNVPRFTREVHNWFVTLSPQFLKMYEVINADYNPIHNFDRHEVYTDAKNQTISSNASSDSESSNTSEQMVSAFNTSSYSNDSKDNVNNISSVSTRAGGTTTDNITHEGHLYGNIGVTTTQQMIEAELELRKYDLYLEIAKMFERRFIVQVY